MEQMRLDRFLANSGCGTRSEIKKKIRNGLIRVGDQIEKDPGRKIVPGVDPVFLDGRRILLPGDVYYMLNKAAGTITATRDRNEPTVMDDLKMEGRGDLFPVGRLDLDTEGLLLITNDGELGHRLTSPAWHVDKTYGAVVEGRVGPEQITLFAQGLDIGDEKKTLPARLCVLMGEEEKQQLLHDWRICKASGRVRGGEAQEPVLSADQSWGGEAQEPVLSADQSWGGEAQEPVLLSDQSWGGEAQALVLSPDRMEWQELYGQRQGRMDNKASSGERQDRMDRETSSGESQDRMDRETSSGERQDRMDNKASSGERQEAGKENSPVSCAWQMPEAAEDPREAAGAGSALSVCLVTLHEGRYHQVKRMFEAVGGKVLYLKRLAMGPVQLDKTLRPGEYRTLTEEEILALRKAVQKEQ